MHRIIFMLGLLFLFFSTNVIPDVCAGDSQYGSVHAWFQHPGGEWENATAHPCLKRSESFSIRVEVTTRAPVQVFFVKLHEFGTPVFEVLSGPTVLEQLLEYRNPLSSNQTFSYQWIVQVRPNTSWVNAVAPLEVFVQFNKNDTEYGIVDFDVLTAYIQDVNWNGTQIESSSALLSSPPNPKPMMPGFPSIICILAIIFGVLLRKKIVLV